MKNPSTSDFLPRHADYWYGSLNRETQNKLAGAFLTIRESAWTYRHRGRLEEATWVGMAASAIVTGFIFGNTAPVESSLFMATVVPMIAASIPFWGALWKLRLDSSFLTRCSLLAGIPRKSQTSWEAAMTARKLTAIARRGGVAGKAAILAGRLLPLFDKRKALFAESDTDYALLKALPCQTESDKRGAHLLREKLANLERYIVAGEAQIDKLAFDYAADSVRLDLAEKLEGYLLTSVAMPSENQGMEPPLNEFSDESGRLKTAVSLDGVVRQ